MRKNPYIFTHVVALSNVLYFFVEIQIFIWYPFYFPQGLPLTYSVGLTVLMMNTFNWCLKKSLFCLQTEKIFSLNIGLWSDISFSSFGTLKILFYVFLIALFLTHIHKNLLLHLSLILCMQWDFASRWFLIFLIIG